MYKSPYHPQNLIITGSALYQSFKICCKATAMMHLWNNWTVTNSNCKASSWTSAVIYSVCCSVQTLIFNESRISTDVLPCQPSRKKTQQLYLDALANTSLCQSRHLPCYHISFPKTQFYTAISSSVFLQNHSTVEVRRNLWALLLQTLVKQGDSEQGALHRVQEAFEHLWRPYSLSGQTVPALHLLNSTEVLPGVQREHPALQLVTTPLVLALGSSEKSWALHWEECPDTTTGHPSRPASPGYSRAQLSKCLPKHKDGA